MAMSPAQRFLYLNSLIKRCYCARLMTWHLCCFIFISHCVSLTNILRFSAKEKKKVVQKKREITHLFWFITVSITFCVFVFFSCKLDGKIAMFGFTWIWRTTKKNNLAQFYWQKKTVLKSIKKDLQSFWRQTFKPILFSST